MFKKIVMGMVALAIVGMIALPQDAAARRGADNPPDPVEIEIEVEED